MKNEKEELKSIYLYDDGIGKVDLVDYMGTDTTIVNAARVSFGKHKEEMDDSDIKLIKYLIKNNHSSVLEHNVITFRFKVPLFVRSQHMRHRTWQYLSVNEISRRYTDENLEFYVPPTLRRQHESNRQASSSEIIEGLDHITCRNSIVEHHCQSIKLYNDLLDRGVARELARGVLPQNLYTEYYGTVNLNNALKFIDLRMDSHAQFEIQVVAKAMLSFMKDLWPNAIDSYMTVKGLVDV